MQSALMQYEFISHTTLFQNSFYLFRKVLVLFSLFFAKSLHGFLFLKFFIMSSLSYYFLVVYIYLAYGAVADNLPDVI